MSITFNPFTGNFDNAPSMKKAKSVYTSVSDTSANWNSVYSTVYAKSATEWDNSLVQTYANNAFLPLSGGTMSGKLTLLSPTSVSANFNIGHHSGPIPTNRIVGDMFINSSSLYYQIPNTPNPRQVAIVNGTNGFSDSQTIETFGSTTSLRITQRGIGDAFRVDDSTHPDASPFIIDNVGSVGVGLSSLSGIDAKLTVVGNISSTGVLFASGGNSELWNSSYSTVNSNSATEWDNSLVQTYANNAFLPLSGGSMNGKIIAAADSLQPKLNIGNALPIFAPATTIDGDVWITNQSKIAWRANSQLIVAASVGQINTFTQPQVIQSTSNSSPALRITQTGLGNAFVVEDFTHPDATPFIVDSYGSVGVGLSSLSGIDAKLTVVGNVSSTGVLYASGGNSDLWNSAYTTVQSNSAIWDMAQYNAFLPLSGGTMSGKLIVASDATGAKLNIGSVIVNAPNNSPNNYNSGDMWIGGGNGNKLCYAIGTGTNSSGNSYFQIANANQSNFFTQNQTIDVSSTNASGAALRVTQRGLGDAFRVDDSPHPDSSAFIIDANGTVGIGLSSLSGIDAKLTVVGNISASEEIYVNSQKVVKTVTTNTPQISAVSKIVAVTALPLNPDFDTLYIVI